VRGGFARRGSLGADSSKGGPRPMEYPVLIRFCLFGIASLGATFLLGCLRRFPLGFVASVAAGAYVAACVRIACQCPWPVAIGAGALAGGLVAWVPAALGDSLVGDEYAIFSWMTAIATYEVISMLEITGGQHSLTGIPPLFSGTDGLARTAWTLAAIQLVLL